MRWVVVAILALGVAKDAAAQREIGPAPGALVSVDGRNIHVLCSGAGAPAVLLEAGASSFAIDWTLVQRELASSTRVCSYDRAGHGWSDPSPGVLGATVIPDLKAVLSLVGVRPPFVLVGASAGALYVREYQVRYPEDVAALVLVDPASEERLFTLRAGRPVLIASLTEEELRETVPQGPLAISPRSPQEGAPFDRLPPDLYRTRVALEAKLIAEIPDTVPYDLVLASAQLDRSRLSALRLASSGGPTPLGTLPLVVLSRGLDSSQGLVDTHLALAGLSTNSRHVVVEGSGHEIHLFQPEVVVGAIRDVLGAVSSGTRLPAR